MARNRNRLIVPEAKDAVNQMKFEIANEAMQSSTNDNLAHFSGSIGGTITKRLVTLGEKELLAKQNTNPKK